LKFSRSIQLLRHQISLAVDR